MTRTRKKVGRKPKPLDQRRNVLKQLCFTQNEWDIVAEAAASIGIEPGVYAREAVVAKAIQQA